MAIKKFSHPDGGTYVIVNDHGVSMKMDDGRWEPAVYYRRVKFTPELRWTYEGKNHHVTTKARWAERFTEIPE